MKKPLKGNTDSIAPYVYKNNSNGVSIKVAVGFYRNLPSEEEEENLLSGRSTTEKLVGQLYAMIV